MSEFIAVDGALALQAAQHPYRAANALIRVLAHLKDIEEINGAPHISATIRRIIQGELGA